MVIKTITCHDVYNVGASLQAYALVTYLNSMGHDAEIINYKPDYLRHYTLFGSVSGRYDYPFVRQLFHIAKLPGRIKEKNSKRKKEYDYFTQKYLPVTDTEYSSNSELQKNPPVADVFFAGSDQIWNTIFPNGKDPAFYLDFVSDGAVKASYAASFATQTIEKNVEEKVKQWLSRLDFISVRESSGVRIIQDLGLKATQVLDPVFLLDTNAWLKIEKDLALNEPYILFYDFDGSKSMSDFAIKLARKKQCRIYSILPSAIADRCFAHEGPAAFICLIRNAELVVSNSFHATAFSIIFKKQFFVFKRTESINTRMTDLVEGLGLSNRLIESDNEFDEEQIDYSIAEKRLSEQIRHSKQFIEEVLESVSDKNEKKHSDRH